MGRELKRVALDFNWPVGTIWKGFISPYRSIECKRCEGSGENDATRELSRSWYNLGGPRHSGWCYHLEQSEVDALIEKDRLRDFTSIFVPGEGWKPRTDAHVVTAAEVNDWARKTMMAHDAINRWICVESRARRLGVWGHCDLCSGKGRYWCDEKYEALSEAWEQIEPPEGDGFQVWETVSEGAPITPVFSTAHDLAMWCAAQTDGWFKRNSPYEQWMKFIDSGWVPSMVIENGVMKVGVDAA